MAKLIYSAIASLDEYVEDRKGKFDWAAPDEEVLAFVNDLERPIGTYLYGRRMYETMVFWETVSTSDDQPAVSRDYTQIWRAAEKIVYSGTLQAPSSERTRIERDFDPAAIRRLKESSARDITVGGAGLAGEALAAGLVDECHLFLVPVIVGGGRYYYSDGVWYAPRGPGFVVVTAPVGMFIPVLPPYYSTVWVAGVPYYYANDTYYVWQGDASGYQVVDPPGAPADQASMTTQPPPSDDLYIYPQSGQTEEQQSNDKYECHKWASSQAGFDPTQSLGCVSPDQVASKRADYQRAMRACLEGRGYSVR